MNAISIRMAAWYTYIEGPETDLAGWYTHRGRSPQGWVSDMEIDGSIFVRFVQISDLKGRFFTRRHLQLPLSLYLMLNYTNS